MQELTGLAEIMRLERDAEHVKRELVAAYATPAAPIAVLVVVHNQLPAVRDCFRSIAENTTDYELFVWDNGSDPETKTWLQTCSQITRLERRETNDGFITPNNALADIAARKGTAEYLVLLNTDTVIVSPLWARAMHGTLDEEIGVVGYGGSLLDATGKGFARGYGEDVDYVEGWSLCLAVETYARFGLFDAANLAWAYGEDADLSLRLNESGLRPYGLYSGAVRHHGGKTVQALFAAGDRSMFGAFEANHSYLAARWGNYLLENRVLARPGL